MKPLAEALPAAGHQSFWHWVPTAGNCRFPRRSASLYRAAAGFAMQGNVV